MKRMLVLSILVCVAMISACQKHDSAADAQFAQKKAELDAREKALDQREKAISDREKTITRFRAIPPDLQSRKPAIDPEQAKAEREKRIQQLPPELQALIRDHALVNPRAGKPTAPDDRVAELQRRLEEARSKKMNAMTPPTTDGVDTQSASPVPSPTPE